MLRDPGVYFIMWDFSMKYFSIYRITIDYDYDALLCTAKKTQNTLIIDANGRGVLKHWALL